MVVIFKRKISPPLIIGYAIAEGIFLGAITGVFNQWYPGIAAQAIVGTLGVFGGMLVVYKTGAIRVTPRLTKMIIGGIIGIVVLMLFNLVMSLFGVEHRAAQRRPDGDRVLDLCIALAAFSFLLDFDSIDKAIKQGAPANTVVVLRLRPDGHPGLAVPGDPAAAQLHAELAPTAEPPDQLEAGPPRSTITTSVAGPGLRRGSHRQGCEPPAGQPHAVSRPARAPEPTAVPRPVRRSAAEFLDQGGNSTAIARP